MTTNRHLSDVIDELIAAEPELSKLLHSSRNRALYCAPEMMIHVWNDVARLLSEAYPDRVDLQATYNGTTPPVVCGHCNHVMVEIGRTDQRVFYKCECHRHKGCDWDWQTALIDGVEYEIGTAGSFVHECPTCDGLTYRNSPSSERCLLCHKSQVVLKRHGQPYLFSRTDETACDPKPQTPVDGGVSNSPTTER